MSRVVILGSAYSIPNEAHGNTHLAVVTEDRAVLIDAVGDTLIRLEKVGILAVNLDDLILTHFHPDHASGFPLLIMDMWLLGRKKPLDVYGLAHTIDRVEAMMELYEWNTWKNLFPVTFHRIPDIELSPVISMETLAITASPVKHFIPAIALRMAFPDSGETVTYSGDTAFCPQIINLSQGSDALVHEASGASEGHSSARQAGEVARAAGAKSLYLIHYPPEKAAAGELENEAKETFAGPVYLARDFMHIDIPIGEKGPYESNGMNP